MAKHTAKFNWKSFAHHLREMREAADLGLREAARSAGTHHATWCRAEQGKPLTVPIFLRLCDWMNSNPFQYLPQKAAATRKPLLMGTVGTQRRPHAVPSKSASGL